MSFLKRRFRLARKANNLFYLQEKRFFKWRDVLTEGKHIANANKKEALILSNVFILQNVITFEEIGIRQ